MRHTTYSLGALCLAGALSLGMAGCKSNGSDVQAATDPADINSAPATGQDPNAAPQTADQTAPAQTAPAQQAYAPAPRRAAAPAQSSPSYQEPQQQQYQQPAAAPQQYADNSGYDAGSTYYDNDTSNYDQGYEAGIQATQPPPPLPEYQQPPCPEDGYQWTPGYWNYAQNGGYYWVPGVWVAPPYQGGLWTPGFWGVVAGVFRFHEGYWGPHVGYYGGIPYGNGYNGDGFHGGYWNNGNFMYNRSVVNVNNTNIRNVYNYNVTNITNNNTRISYNGPGGIQARPTPAQIAVLREPHVRPLPQQIAHVQQAQQNRAQFAAENHGRPAVLVAPKPIVLQHVAVAPALANPGIRGAVAHPANLAVRPNEARPNEARPEAARPEAARPGVAPAARPNEARPEAARPNEARPAEARPGTPAARPEAARPEPARPATTVNHPAPQAQHPAARPEPQAAHPAARPEPQAAHPAPAAHAAPQAQHPAAQARPEAHPAAHPQAKPEAARPAAKPEERPKENRPEQH